MLEVAVGLLCNADGQVLVSQRGVNTHLPGTWEFPGGKFEAGETSQQALSRELSEELGIKVLAAQPLITLRHRYPEKTVRLHVFEVMRWQGEPHSREQQSIRWVNYQQLTGLDMPAADAPILKALRLPGQYLITPPCPAGQQAVFLQQLERSLMAGIGVVQLRQPGMPLELLQQLAEVCWPVCVEAGARLVINGGVELIDQCPVDGLHLSGAQLIRLAGTTDVRDLLKPGQLLGASCHDAEQLKLALQLDCDYALLSPVKPTSSHPDTRPMGWGRFRGLTTACNMPVYALGGMQPQDQDQARANGAIGVAGISGFWRS